MNNTGNSEERDMSMPDNKKAPGSRFLNVLREFIEGAIVREPMLVTIKEKANLETLFLLMVFGDTLGIPVPRSYYSLRLLPYVVPRLGPWKRALLRQRDWTDFAFD